MKLKKQSGFSLVEVLIVAGLLGGLALVIANINKNMSTTIRRAESTSEIVNIHSAISQILLSGRGCVNTLFGTNVNAPFTFNTIQSQTNPPYAAFTVGETYGQDRARITSLEGELDGPLTVVNANERTGNLLITIGYERINTVNMGTPYTIERELNLQIITNNAGELQECYSAEYNAIETARQLACEGIEGTYDAVSGNCTLIPYGGFGAITNRTNAAISENYIRQLFAVEVGSLIRIGPGAVDTTKNFVVNVPTTHNADVTLTGATSLLMPSDYRLKKNITPLKDALSVIDRLKLVSFDWKSTSNKDIGVIAQDLQRHYPELVTTSSDGSHLLVKYPQLSVIALQGVKELSLRNKQLEKDNQELKEQVNMIKKMLCSRDPYEEFCQ